MRVLIVSTIMPYPAIYGSAIRTMSLLRALASEGVEISFLTLTSQTEPAGDLQPLREVCRHVQTVGVPLRSLSSSADYGRRARALLDYRPYAALRYRSQEMQSLIQRQLAGRRFDAVIADMLFSMVNMPVVPVPLIANLHNVEYLILKRYLRFERNPVKRGYAWMESEKLRRWEQHACRRANLVTVCSNYDRDVLLAHTDVPVMTVPNVVDTVHYAPCSGGGEGFTVMYQGGMDWFPNRDAVEYFASSILPIVRQRVPGARLVVAGRNPSPEFIRKFKGDSGIEFTGTVSDMRPVIERAQVCVVPLRIGSGTRLKILESAAMGKAVVATRLGAEGLDFRDGEEILLEDEPIAFANAVSDLLLDPGRRRSVGAAARRCVEERYSFPALRSAVRSMLESLRPVAEAVTVSVRA